LLEPASLATSTTCEEDEAWSLQLNLSSLPDGEYSFKLRHTRRNGNRQTDLETGRYFKITQTPPALAGVPTREGITVSSGAQFVLIWLPGVDSSGQSLTGYEYVVNTTPAVPVNPAWVSTGSNTFATINVPSGIQASGDTFYVLIRGIDVLGQPTEEESVNVSLDLSPPNLSSVSLSATPSTTSSLSIGPTISWNATTVALSDGGQGSGVEKLQYRITSAGITIRDWTELSASLSQVQPEGLVLSDGTTYQFDLRAIDFAANASSPISTSWSVSIVQGGGGSSSSSSSGSSGTSGSSSSGSSSGGSTPPPTYTGAGTAASPWVIDASAVPEPPRSCFAIRSMLNESPSGTPWSVTSSTGQNGVYRITVSGAPLSVYCDMTSDNGGWTLVLNAVGSDAGTTADGNGNTWSSSVQGYDPSNVSLGSTFRYSDSLINSLKGNRARYEKSAGTSRVYFNPSSLTFDALGTSAVGQSCTNANLTSGCQNATFTDTNTGPWTIYFVSEHWPHTFAVTPIGRVYCLNQFGITNFSCSSTSWSSSKNLSLWTRDGAFTWSNPGAPVSFVDGSSSGSGVTPTLSWDAATASNSGPITDYQIAIGTTAGGTDIRDWTSVGNTLSTTISGLSLSTGSTYFASVRASDANGNLSYPVLGDGWIAQLQFSGSGTLADPWVSTSSYNSCQALRQGEAANPAGQTWSTTSGTGQDGIYSLTVNSVSGTKIYCDMTTDGGGWSLLLAAVGGFDGGASWSSSTSGINATSPSTTSTFRLSDSQINALKGSRGRYTKSAGTSPLFFGSTPLTWTTGGALAVGQICTDTALSSGCLNSTYSDPQTGMWSSYFNTTHWSHAYAALPVTKGTCNNRYGLTNAQCDGNTWAISGAKLLLWGR